ncbi:hypothetical protein BDA96_09G029800 [Sorghum bicolor]|uniref:Uncharacterized protein n=1 Tax=Sorghum bicolor TaxID=4558 RepID=A0A921U3K8_SORBI|nr:hypothetical protein BDA96_09G029800 [Sorghum bicolor]
MFAIEHDCKKLAFQHNLDNNFGSKQRKVSMKLMSVKSGTGTALQQLPLQGCIIPQDKNLLLSQQVLPQVCKAWSRAVKFCLSGRDYGLVVSSCKDLAGPFDHIHTVSHNLPPSKCRCPQRHNTLWLTIKHVRILPPPLCHPDDTPFAMVPVPA